MLAALRDQMSGGQYTAPSADSWARVGRNDLCPCRSGIQSVLDDVSINVVGDVSWVESRAHFSNQAGATRAVRVIGVFVRENGGWKRVQSHAPMGVPNEEIFG